MQQNNPLKGRTLYFPEMCYAGTRGIAASFRSGGVDAQAVPSSDKESLELGAKHTSGDECFPQKVTLGNFLKVLREKPASECAFFMPIAQGPCRFGQYATHTKQVLEELGYNDAIVYSPTSEDGYKSIGGHNEDLERTIWITVLATDILRQLLHRTRPFEKQKGETDTVFKEAVEEVCDVSELQGIKFSRRKSLMKEALKNIRAKFREIEKFEDPGRPLIGVVGEIFCRLDTFSNSDVVRKVEEAGGWCWVSNISEWILYTSYDKFRKMKLDGQGLSKEMLISKIRYKVLRRDEHEFFSIFKDDFKGCENESDIGKLLKNSEPYLPSYGALGEMTVNASNVVHFHHSGAAGVIDISPFSCMNGIICESVYPKMSDDLGGMPIRLFYFDGLNTNLDRDIGIFLELARSYQDKK